MLAPQPTSYCDRIPLPRAPAEMSSEEESEDEEAPRAVPIANGGQKVRGRAKCRAQAWLGWVLQHFVRRRFGVGACADSAGMGGRLLCTYEGPIQPMVHCRCCARVRRAARRL